MYYKSVLHVSTWIWQLQQESSGEVSRGLCSGSASRSGFIRVVIWETAKIGAQGWWKVPGEHRFLLCFCFLTRESLARIILNSYSVGTTCVRVAGMEVSGRKWPKYEERPPSSYSRRYMETWRRRNYCLVQPNTNGASWCAFLWRCFIQLWNIPV